MMLVAADISLAEHGDGERGVWILDSGATFNFTPYAEDLQGPLSAPWQHQSGSPTDRYLDVTGMGVVKCSGIGGTPLTVTQVHLVPGLHSRLMSVPHLTERDLSVTFTKGGVRAEKDGKVLFEGQQIAGRGNKLFRATLPNCSHTPTVGLALLTAVPLEVAHRRMAHANPATILRMAKDGSVKGLNIQKSSPSDFHCTPCPARQGHAPAFPRRVRDGAH